MTAPTSSEECGYQFALARKSPRLDRELELQLTRRWRDSGDRGAADILMRAHLRTVLALAMKYRGFRVALADLISEGNYGLVQALRRFDPERGVRFVTCGALDSCVHVRVRSALR